LRKTVIVNPQILYGEELEIIKRGSIIVNEDGIIEKVIRKSIDRAINPVVDFATKTRETKIIDAEGFIVIPGFVNSHIHMGDSIGKDIGANSDINKRIHPHYGIKKTILEKTPKPNLVQMMRHTVLSMLNKGITTFVDFREGGLEGINLLHKAISNTPIRGIILGRIDFNKSYNDNSDLDQLHKDSNHRLLISNKTGSFFSTKVKGETELRKKEEMVYRKENQINSIIENGNLILDNCDGFGISGANENSDAMLSLYNKLIHDYDAKNTNPIKRYRKPYLAIHAAEAQSTVKESIKKYKKTEIKRTLELLDPDIYIHVTNPTKFDLKLLHKNRKKIVICPRANGILGVGLTPIRKMLELDFILGIGTDNVMLNSPDMFKEMDFLIKSQRAFEKDSRFLIAKEVLKMATVNGGKIFNLNTGCIKRGYQADLLFIDRYDLDLYPMLDPHMAIVNRCTERQIKAIMINGKLTSENSCLN
jgi:cytosine/adenosine deaminase-related metal-dependent hydrolase